MRNEIVATEGEKTLAIIRHSFMKMWKQWLRMILALSLGICLLIFFTNQYIVFFAMVLILGDLFYLGIILLVRFYDIIIITNKRLVVIEKNKLFHRNKYEVDARDIVTVSSSRKGLLPMIFSYGVIEIENRAGKQIKLQFIPDTDYVTEVIHTLAATSNRA